MTDRVKNLVFHVGDIKSATTSVQVALAAGCQPQYAENLIYPVRGLNHNYLEKVFREDDLASRPPIRWLRREMASGRNVDVCIISGERLSVLPPRRLKAAITTAFGDLAERVTIVHYVRPHLDRMLSAYAERVKIGTESRPLHDALTAGLESGRFLQARRLHQWKKTFGEDYRLRPMIPARLARGDAVADFFDTVFGSLPEDWSPPRPTNEALSASGLAQVARLQKLLTDAPASLRHALGYEFAWLYVKATKGSPVEKIGLDADLAERLRDAFMADARTLDEELFHGEDLFVPALLSGARKALEGNDRPLEIPADQAGQEIIAKLMKMVRSGSDQARLARRLRNARYKRYLRAARRS